MTELAAKLDQLADEHADEVNPDGDTSMVSGVILLVAYEEWDGVMVYTIPSAATGSLVVSGLIAEAHAERFGDR